MEHRKLGRSGLSVSALCLGMMSYGSPRWQPGVLEDRECRRFVRQALDAGINFFDTADFYSLGASEQALGQAISDLCRRQDVVISTKVGLPMDQSPNGRGLSRKHILESVDASLKRLGTYYIDHYKLHVADSLTPVEETVDALTDLVRAGKIYPSLRENPKSRIAPISAFRPFRRIRFSGFRVNRVYSISGRRIS